MHLKMWWMQRCSAALDQPPPARRAAVGQRISPTPSAGPRPDRHVEPGIPARNGCYTGGWPISTSAKLWMLIRGPERSRAANGRASVAKSEPAPRAGRALETGAHRRSPGHIRRLGIRLLVQGWRETGVSIRWRPLGRAAAGAGRAGRRGDGMAPAWRCAGVLEGFFCYRALVDLAVGEWGWLCKGGSRKTCGGALACMRAGWKAGNCQANRSRFQ